VHLVIIIPRNIPSLSGRKIKAMRVERYVKHSPGSKRYIGITSLGRLDLLSTVGINEKVIKRYIEFQKDR